MEPSEFYDKVIAHLTSEDIYHETLNALRALEGPVLVIAHTRPDGDAIGSLQAMRLMLQDMGHTVIACSPDTPAYLAFAAEGLARELPGIDSYKSVVCVDTASAGDRLTGGDEALAGKVVVNIDHHQSNTFQADHQLLIPTASSACEIIHDLRRVFGRTWKSDKAELAFAEAVYLGLATDTGNFGFSLTTPHTMQVAAACMETGADIVSIRNELAKRSVDEIRLMQAALASLRWECEDSQGRPQLAVVHVPHFETADGSAPNMQPILSMLRGVEGVKAAVSLTQLSDELIYRVSIRSNPPLDVASVAERFEGGGHKQAAGARVKAGSEQQLIDALCDAIRATS
jgi:phosphoesterase RecJ-like protein